MYFRVQERFTSKGLELPPCVVQGCLTHDKRGKKVKKALLTVLCSTLAGFALAELLVNGGFDSGFIGTNTRVYAAVQDAGGDGEIVDDGWLVSDPACWDISGGTAVRNTINQNNQYGIGQIVSNPDDGTYDDGNTIVFKFNWNVVGSGDSGIDFRVYGIVGSGKWLAGSQGLDRISLLSPESGDIANSTETRNNPYNYYLEELLAGAVGIGTTNSGTVAESYTLDFNYGYFAVGIYADNDNAGIISIDNVSITVPEPITTGMMGLGTLVLLLARRIPRLEKSSGLILFLQQRIRSDVVEPTCPKLF